MQQADYYTVMPAKIRFDKKLTASAKLLYGDIKFLSQKEGFCWSEDRYFAELYEVDIRTVQRWIGSLEKQGYIFIQHQTVGHKDYRKIFIKDSESEPKVKTNEKTKMPYPLRQKCRIINTEEKYKFKNNHHPYPSEVKPLKAGLTDDSLQSLEKKLPLVELLTNDKELQCNITSIIQLMLEHEVYSAVSMTKKDLYECIKIKNGSLEHVLEHIKFVQESPKRKNEINDWPNALRSWKMEKKTVDRSKENEETGKKLEQQFSNSTDWKFQVYNDRQKDQKGVLFYHVTAQSNPFSFPTNDPEFDKKVSECMAKVEKTRLIKSGNDRIQIARAV